MNAYLKMSTLRVLTLALSFAFVSTFLFSFVLTLPLVGFFALPLKCVCVPFVFELARSTFLRRNSQE